MADAHPAFRAGIRSALDARFSIVGHATSAVEAVRLCRELRPDLALVAVELPGGSTAAITEIASTGSTRVIAVAEETVEELVVQMIEAGAAGYVDKSMTGAALPAMLLAVAEGEVALPRKLVGILFSELRARVRNAGEEGLPARGIRVTPREREVLELMRQRLTTAEIAERLWISPVTVRRHISTLVRRLGVDGRQEAVRLFERSEA